MKSIEEGRETRRNLLLLLPALLLLALLFAYPLLGIVNRSIYKAGYTLQVRVNPNRAVTPNSFQLDLSKNGTPVRGANVTRITALVSMPITARHRQHVTCSSASRERLRPARGADVFRPPSRGRSFAPC